MLASFWALRTYDDGIRDPVYRDGHAGMLLIFCLVRGAMSVLTRHPLRAWSLARPEWKSVSVYSARLLCTEHAYLGGKTPSKRSIGDGVHEDIDVDERHGKPSRAGVGRPRGVESGNETGKNSVWDAHCNAASNC